MDTKMPYIIGVGGSVAAGQVDHRARAAGVLARWPNVPKVDLRHHRRLPLPQCRARREGLMEKKGFPESYDLPALLRFLSGPQGRPPPGARAGLFASHLRRHPEPVDRDRTGRKS